MDEPLTGPEDRIAEDLRALGTATARDLPAFTDTVRRLRADVGDRRTRVVSWGAWVGAASTAAVALAFVTFSYPIETGHDVVLTVSSPMSAAAREEVARGLRAGFTLEALTVDTKAAATRFHARVRGLSDAEAEGRIETLARVLCDRVGDVRFTVAPWTTAASGNVYTFATDRVRRLLVQVQGRTAREIEADILARLDASGFRDARVEVERGDGTTSIDLRATDGSGGVLQTEIRQEVRGAADGAEPPVAIALPDFSDLAGLPPEARRAAIERRLRDSGIDARVTIENGKLRIDATDVEVEREPRDEREEEL